LILSDKNTTIWGNRERVRQKCIGWHTKTIKSVVYGKLFGDLGKKKIHFKIYYKAKKLKYCMRIK
jgi:hypothetical protein